LAIFCAEASSSAHVGLGGVPRSSVNDRASLLGLVWLWAGCCIGSRPRYVDAFPIEESPSMKVRCPRCQAVRDTSDSTVTATCLKCGWLFKAELNFALDTPIREPEGLRLAPVEKAVLADATEPERAKGKVPPATEKQLKFLATLGQQVGATIPDALDVREASALIERLKKQQRQMAMSEDPATVKQLEFILVLGGRPWNGMSKLEASELIEWFEEYETENDLTCAKCGSWRHAGEAKCRSCGGFLKAVTVEHPDREELALWSANRQE